MRLLLFLILFFTYIEAEEIDWSQPQSAISKGLFFSHQMFSKHLNNKRDIWVYTPHNYSSTANPYPLLIVFDGQLYLSEPIPIPIILDNLAAFKYIPQMVAVFISSLDEDHRNIEFPCYPPFMKFVGDELLPWLQGQYNVTKNPTQTVVTGSSYGGLAAVYAGLMYPDKFRNILSQSGAFYWNEEWIIKKFAKIQALPLKFYLDVGNQEAEMAFVNQHLYDVLRAKGYEVTYKEFIGDHDYQCWRNTFPTGLRFLIGYKKQ